MIDARRNLPSVAALLEMPGIAALIERAPRTVVVAAIREVVERARRDPVAKPGDTHEWCAAIARVVEAVAQPSLRPVLNGTGVVLHTNLGRAPLADAAITAIAAVAAGYSNLEYDLESGTRGSRYAHCTALLRELTGADDALVVNNGAAALVLALNTVAEGRSCLVSRGELVEIGGSFRIPDIMAKSGARLVEVGATNRTHLGDYAAAIAPDTAAIVKVHRSNFSMRGFVADVSVPQLSTLAATHALTLLHDLGSGLLISVESAGLSGEPTAGEALTAGATLVTMSGDKLLGGPQAGIILGRADVISAIRNNSLTRSYRVDKLTLAALGATLQLYREPARAWREIPVLAQLATSVSELRDRAEQIIAALSTAVGITVMESEASVGGGAFPEARIPSVALGLTGDLRALERRLRAGTPPVITRTLGDRLLVDLRTILPRDDARLCRALDAALA